jgi:hypothetical protein
VKKIEYERDERPGVIRQVLGHYVKDLETGEKKWVPGSAEPTLDKRSENVAKKEAVRSLTEPSEKASEGGVLRAASEKYEAGYRTAVGAIAGWGAGDFQDAEQDGQAYQSAAFESEFRQGVGNDGDIGAYRSAGRGNRAYHGRAYPLYVEQDEVEQDEECPSERPLVVDCRFAPQPDLDEEPRRRESSRIVIVRLLQGSAGAVSADRGNHRGRRERSARCGGG